MRETFCYNRRLPLSVHFGLINLYSPTRWLPNIMQDLTTTIRAKRRAIYFRAGLTLALVVSVASAVSAQRQSQQQIEARIDALISHMTLAEKLGQLQQLDGESNGNFRPEHLELIRKGLLGAALNVRGAQRTNQLQRVAMEESRLKIPVLLGFDTIHGYRTIFPIPLAEASSWEPSLAERSAGIAAKEIG